jgi:hypothetical protein
LPAIKQRLQFFVLKSKLREREEKLMLWHHKKSPRERGLLLCYPMIIWQ